MKPLSIAFNTLLLCTFIGVIEPAYSQDNPSFIGKCLLEIDKRKYIDGKCDITMEKDGGFAISASESKAVSYFAVVSIISKDTGEGYWNEEEGATHAHTPLGNLTRHGACWENKNAKVCAYKLGNDASSLPAEFNCKQIIFLYSLTSQASIQCDYHYSKIWIESARECASKLSEHDREIGINAGISTFKDNVSEHGLKYACKDVLGAFPDAIRK